jgi:hypothetical protein
MSDAENSDDGPAVELGEGPSLKGAPIARIAARFQWGREKSAIVEREGDATIRTPEGPRPLEEILEELEETYFPTRQDFIAAVREEIGHGPVPTEE